MYVVWSFFLTGKSKLASMPAGGGAVVAAAGSAPAAAGGGGSPVKGTLQYEEFIQHMFIYSCLS